MAFDGSTATAREIFAVLEGVAVSPPPPPTWKAPPEALPPGTEGSVNWPGCARLHTAPATIREVHPAVPGDDAGRRGEFVYTADVPAAATGTLILWPDEFRKSKGKPDRAAPSMSIVAAKESGYTGDPCTTCGSMRMVRSGACAKCNECGATSGCS